MDRLCRSRLIFPKEIFFAFLATYLNRYNGGKVKEFEDSFAKYINKKYAIAVSSAKCALFLCLKALCAKKGDEIIVPAYTVSEVIELIILLGLRPIFIDINLEDGNMDENLIEQKIGEKTKYILMTHIYGYPCEVDKILEIARQHRLIIIEDAAQACGAEYKARRVGGFGDVGYFSFGLLKNLNTLEGGIIVTDDNKLALSLRNLINNFKPIAQIEIFKRLLIMAVLSLITHPFIFRMVIYPAMNITQFLKHNKWEIIFRQKKVTLKLLNKLKIKFSDLQAVLGLEQLKAIDKNNEVRVKRAQLLNKMLKNIEGLTIFKEKKYIKNIYLNYVMRVNDRQNLIKYLFWQGIDTGPGFVVCCAHLRQFNCYYCHCPNSEVLEKQHLYLPIYQGVKTEHLFLMSELIRKYYERKKPRTR